MATKVSTVTTIKAPLDETLKFVNYHLNIGVSHMFLCFDDPNDISIEALADNERVTCIRCDSNHWASLTSKAELSIEQRQILNANYAFKLAQRARYDWLIHIDNDELIYVDKSFDILLSNVSQNVKILVIEPLETVPEQTKYQSFFEEVTLFKNKDSLWQKYLAYVLGCRRVFQGGYYFRGHPYGKSAIRTDAEIQSTEIHYPIAAKGKNLKTKRFIGANLLHFDCCSFESWKRKWIRRYDGTATAILMRPDRKKQFAKFIEAYESGKIQQLIELYEEQYFLSSYERKILRMLGLLKRIELDEQLFQSPSAT
jgi:hypothetical protein